VANRDKIRIRRTRL